MIAGIEKKVIFNWGTHDDDEPCINDSDIQLRGCGDNEYTPMGGVEEWENIAFGCKCLHMMMMSNDRKGQF